MPAMHDADDEDHAFGVMLRRFRDAAHLTQDALAERAGLSTDAVKRIEAGERRPRSATVRALADALQHALDLPPEDRWALEHAADPDAAPLLSPPAPGSRLRNLSRNPVFVGRRREMHELAWMLDTGQVRRGEPPRAAAISGMAGVGKTQLAVEFIHRYGRCFDAVFWLDFGDDAAIAGQIAGLGGPGYLDLHPRFGTLSREDQLQLVLTAWQSPARRLLVFDNCEDQALFVRWRPETGGCRVLVTTQRLEWDVVLGVHMLPLDIFSRQESVTLLGKYRDDLAAAGNDLFALVDQLGCLPLALHLAGSYLRENPRLSVTAFLAELGGDNPLQHRALQGEVGISPTGHRQHVGRTFGLSYRRLAREDAHGRARALLARCAHFAPGEPIPRVVLLATLAGDGGDEVGARDAEAALSTLARYGLVGEEVGGAVRLHRLLAAAIPAVSEAPDAYRSVAYTLLREVELLDERDDLAPLDAMLVHLRAVAHAAARRADDGEDGWDILNALCCSPSDAVTETLVDVLERHATDDRAAATRLLDRLLASSRRGARRASRARERVPLVVVRVSARIGAVALLAQTMASPLVVVRGEAVRYTYYLWQRDREAALAALRALAARAVRARVLVKKQAIESCLVLSLLLLFDIERSPGEARNPEDRRSLRRVWQALIDTLRTRLPGRFGRRLADAMLAGAVGVVLRYLRRATDEESDRYNCTSFDELAYSLTLTPHEKASFLRLVACLESATIDPGVAEPELRAAMERNDELSAFVFGAILIRLGVEEREPGAAIALMERLFAVERERRPLGWALGQMTFVVPLIQRLRGEWTEQMRDLMARMIDYLAGAQGVWHGKHRDYVTFQIEGMLINEFEVAGQAWEVESVRRYLGAAMEARDTAFILDILFYAGNLRHEQRYWPMLLRNLHPLLAHDEARVHERLVNLLALLRVRDRRAFDTVAASQGLPKPLLKEVCLAGNTESIAGDVLWGGMILLFGESVVRIYMDPARRPHVTRMLRYVARTDSLRDWVVYCIKVAANVAYGDDVFTLIC